MWPRMLQLNHAVTRRSPTGQACLRLLPVCLCRALCCCQALVKAIRAELQDTAETAGNTAAVLASAATSRCADTV